MELEYRLLGEVNPLHGNHVSFYNILAAGAGYLKPTNIRLVDFENKVVYQALQRADNPRQLTGKFAAVDEGAKFPVTALREGTPAARSIALFPAPENKIIMVFVPNLGLISNVSVVKADADTGFDYYIQVAGEPFLDTIEQQVY